MGRRMTPFQAAWSWSPPTPPLTAEKRMPDPFGDVWPDLVHEEEVQIDVVRWACPCCEDYGWEVEEYAAWAAHYERFHGMPRAVFDGQFV